MVFKMHTQAKMTAKCPMHCDVQNASRVHPCGHFDPYMAYFVQSHKKLQQCQFSGNTAEFLQPSGPHHDMMGAIAGATQRFLRMGYLFATRSFDLYCFVFRCSSRHFRPRQIGTDASSLKLVWLKNGLCILTHNPMDGGTTPLLPCLEYLQLSPCGLNLLRRHYENP